MVRLNVLPKFNTKFKKSIEWYDVNKNMKNSYKLYNIRTKKEEKHSNL